MANKPIAIFDIDDTLADLAGPFARYMAEKYNDERFLVDLRFKEVTDYVKANYPGFDVMDELYGLEDSGAFKTLPLNARAFETYRELQESGHEMWLMTARGWMRDGEGETIDWMVHHGITCDKLKVVDLHVCKSLHFPKRAAFYYDDHLGHITKCASICDNIFLVKQPWNSHHELPERVSWFSPIHD